MGAQQVKVVGAQRVKGKGGRLRSLLARGVIGVVAGVVLWIGAAAALDWHGRRQRPQGRHDAIIVAGCRVKPNGTPSPALKRRTRAAVALWNQGLAPKIILTGGLGDHPPTEAAAAAAYARRLGVPARALIHAGRSTSTEENARFAAQVSAARRVIVVTDSYHVFRSRRVFARHFPEVAGYGSTPGPGPRIKGALREVAAIAWYGLAGRL